MRLINVGEGTHGGVDTGSSSESMFGSKVYSRNLKNIDDAGDKPLHHPEYADILHKTVIVTGKQSKNVRL